MEDDQKDPFGSIPISGEEEEPIPEEEGTTAPEEEGEPVAEEGEEEPVSEEATETPPLPSSEPQEKVEKPGARRRRQKKSHLPRSAWVLTITATVLGLYLLVGYWLIPYLLPNTFADRLARAELASVGLRP